ncbi:DNA starvation/stationary phase protection protein [Halarchaeum grantii]|uniref:DNA starvation/stationary phase protection protein n=1 Tax=Halarchaeum grantii TaxID=1193105 RepID=A0A830FB59_9EURY|nr:DNA starvation/stationary phase protection protein DpsA [Halarchaeum grantii]GGL36957.1 DNA starvation/stationary phase protection protein [Halarchaeum grantii]
MTSPQHGRLVHDLEGATVRQAWGTMEENAVRIDRADAERLVGALNADHAGAFNLFYLLRKHYWTAEGAEHEDVADVLKRGYQRARTINDDLAERITQLGGVPASTPPQLQEYAPVHLEAEHLFDLRASLEGDLDAYATLVASMREHVALADDLGDEATSELLREHLEDLEDDAHDIEEFLADDTLVTTEAMRR